MFQNKLFIADHVKKYATIYLFMLVLFLTGVIFGAVIVNSMSFIQKQDLFFYLERFFEQIAGSQEFDNEEILKDSFYYHAKYLVLLFILGLSVVGLPIIWILLFLKGLVVGFSVGFIVNRLSLEGLLLASLSIAPQNLVIIPIYLIAGSLSMIFSLTLLNKLFSRRLSKPLVKPLSQYVIVFVLLLAGALLAALIEAYASNEAMEALIRTFYTK
ncbi:stage II sporulation protein M [Virgibacillus sp. DJP39]|uniref:stage II sporulation protein M n=1 Tax=Virgibacillus sp. DJP39 TaxID=3409790 RepID=UPI003BB6D504